MNSITSSRLFRLTALSALLAILPTAALAKDPASDAAARLLEINGAVAIAAAGPYVEVGTYRVQVAAKLGQPAFRLADGAWLYRDFAVNGSDARGTLLVRFTEGRVSELALVSPSTVVALQSGAQRASDRILIAARGRR